MFLKVEIGRQQYQITLMNFCSDQIFNFNQFLNPQTENFYF